MSQKFNAKVSVSFKGRKKPFFEREKKQNRCQSFLGLNPGTGSCPPDFEDWNENSDYCYVQGQRPAKKEEADEACHEMGAVVVRTHSQEDIDKIYGRTQVSSLWIDLMREGSKPESVAKPRYINLGPFRGPFQKQRPMDVARIGCGAN